MFAQLGPTIYVIEALNAFLLKWETLRNQETPLVKNQ